MILCTIVDSLMRFTSLGYYQRLTHYNFPLVFIKHNYQIKIVYIQTVQYDDLPKHYEMTVTISLISASMTSHSYLCMYICGEKNKHSFKKFQVHYTIWLIMVIVLDIRSPKLTYLRPESILFDCISPGPQPLATTFYSQFLHLTLFRFHI